MNVDSFASSYATSLKMDEIFFTARLRYEARCNTFQGLCYQHAPPNLEFNTFADLESIVEQIKNDQIHVPKECLVVGANRLDVKSKFNVFIAWPTCSKDDYKGTYELVASTSKEYYRLTEKNLMNMCTDGDTSRRIVMHNYCSQQLSPIAPIYDVLGNIPLLDLSRIRESELAI